MAQLPNRKPRRPITPRIHSSTPMGHKEAHRHRGIEDWLVITVHRKEAEHFSPLLFATASGIPLAKAKKMWRAYQALHDQAVKDVLRVFQRPGKKTVESLAMEIGLPVALMKEVMRDTIIVLKKRGWTVENGAWTPPGKNPTGK